jgi:hypothetical protein
MGLVWLVSLIGESFLAHKKIGRADQSAWQDGLSRCKPVSLANRS